MRLQIVDGDGNVVRTLVPGKRLRRGTVTYTWNGRDDRGSFVREGVYKPRVHLTDQHRTIDLPNEMRVDTTAPTRHGRSVAPREFSPDGDGRRDRVVVAYTLREPAHAILLVDGTSGSSSRGGQQPRRDASSGTAASTGSRSRRALPAPARAPRIRAGNISTPKRAAWFACATSRSPAT